MDVNWTDVAKQVPALVVLVFLVVTFLKVLKHIVLKFTEGMAKFIMGGLKTEVSNNLLAMLAAVALVPSVKKFGKRVDASEFGAAPLLGVGGVGFIGHGSADAKAIGNAIRAATKFADRRVNDHIRDLIQENLHVFDGGAR